MEHLHCYASGSGALDFVWLKDDRLPANRTPTLADAGAWLDSDRGDHLKKHNWRVAIVSTKPVLLAPVVRVSGGPPTDPHAGVLSMNDAGYRYVIDPDSLGTNGITDYALKTLEFGTALGPMVCKNQNYRQIVVHFLRNEPEIAAFDAIMRWATCLGPAFNPVTEAHQYDPPLLGAPADAYYHSMALVKNVLGQRAYDVTLEVFHELDRKRTAASNPAPAG